MPDELLQRLRRFHDDTFHGVQDRFETLVKKEAVFNEIQSEWIR